MFYRNGPDFEEAVFGKRSGGLKFVEKFWGQGIAFGPQIQKLLEESESFCPDTQIGQALYRQVAKQLRRYGIDPNGLIFLSAVNTGADAHHGTDGLFYLPSLYPHLVTMDAFNTDERNLKLRREMWIDSFPGQIYSDSDFQSDLFCHKKGFANWRKTHEMSGLSEEGLLRIDFRKDSNAARPENHFVLTPGMIGSYEARRSFAKLVAGYFVKVAGKKMA